MGLGAGTVVHYRMKSQLGDQNAWWSGGKGNCSLRSSQIVSFSQCGTATLRAEAWVILNGTPYKWSLCAMSGIAEVSPCLLAPLAQNLASATRSWGQNEKS